eukprot:scaffold180078_cov30-Tisochrysis_lutea.AAC.1
MEMHEASLLEDISHKIWIAALSTGRQHLQLSKPLLESGKHDECLSSHAITLGQLTFWLIFGSLDEEDGCLAHSAPSRMA